MTTRDIVTATGEVPWAPPRRKLIVHPHDDRHVVRDFTPGDVVVLRARVIRPGNAGFLFVRDEEEAQSRMHELPGHTFTGVARQDRWNVIAFVQTRLLAKLPAATSAVPAQVALANLSNWCSRGESLLGHTWSNGYQNLRVISNDGNLYLTDPDAMDRVARDIPWVDHSGPEIDATLPEKCNGIDDELGIHGGDALAVGAALAALRECGAFVNPVPQTVTRGARLSVTSPNLQISV